MTTTARQDDPGRRGRDHRRVRHALFAAPANAAHVSGGWRPLRQLDGRPRCAWSAAGARRATPR